MPSKTVEWLNLEFSKEFLELIQSSSDADMISKYVFEKAEMTCYYTETIINILEDFGLHVHTVPLYIFLRYFLFF